MMSDQWTLATDASPGMCRARPLFSEVPGGANRQADLNEAGRVCQHMRRHPREIVLVPVCPGSNFPQRRFGATRSQMSDKSTNQPHGFARTELFRRHLTDPDAAL